MYSSKEHSQASVMIFSHIILFYWGIKKIKACNMPHNVSQIGVVAFRVVGCFSASLFTCFSFASFVALFQLCKMTWQYQCYFTTCDLS